MKKIMLKTRNLAVLYLKWGWPLLLTDAALEMWAGPSSTLWRSCINISAFLWVLCAPVLPISLLLDRQRRERAMARLCGIREGDERERSVTGEAARATLLLGLSLEIILLVMSMVSVRLSWEPTVPKGEKHGVLSVGMGFSTERHLDPLGTPADKPNYLNIGAAEPKGEEFDIAGGFLLAPSTFPVLLLLILIQLAAFKALAMRRYEGIDS